MVGTFHYPSHCYSKVTNKGSLRKFCPNETINLIFKILIYFYLNCYLFFHFCNLGFLFAKRQRKEGEVGSVQNTSVSCYSVFLWLGKEFTCLLPLFPYPVPL